MSKIESEKYLNVVDEEKITSEIDSASGSFKVRISYFREHF